MVIHAVKGFGIVNKAEVDIFLELSCIFDDPADFGNFISGYFAFSKFSLNIWQFTVHILLKPGLENFEHYSTSVWDECDCAVVWAFFGIAFLWDWNENWPFLFLWQNSITLNEYTKLIIHSTVNGAVRLFQVFGIVISFAKNILICLLEYVYKGWF